LQSRKCTSPRRLSIPSAHGADIAFEQVKYSDDGIDALVFTSEGDMRQAVNNLQSTFSGFDFVSADAVFKVCDQPHPVTIDAMIRSCHKGDIDTAMGKLQDLWDHGYSAVDIVTTLFRVTKTSEALTEYLKLEFIRVSGRA
jgi:replication factor C subunit 2/4